VGDSRDTVAVMFTDLVGYTSSTQLDETGALRKLADQEELVRPLLRDFGGREIKSTGDGFLVEFEDAQRATQCAIEIQERVHRRNAVLGTIPFDLRISVSWGEVERRGGDIFGFTVNLASRILQSTRPGGVSLSRTVFDQVYGKTSRPVIRSIVAAAKGLYGPLEVYRVDFPWDSAGRAESEAALRRIAVLPLANISPDPNDEYLADGLSEELISGLSLVPGLRVLSRTSTSQYKSSSKSASQIGAELGVASLIEGSVRKSGDRLRIVVQLIDAGTEERTWARSYDREVQEIIALQSEISREVAESLQVRFSPTDPHPRPPPRPVTPDSYLAYLQGRELIEDVTNRSSLHRGIDLFERAISLDKSNARAYVGMGRAIRVLKHYHREGDNSTERSIAYIRKALELDPDLAEAHVFLGGVLRLLPNLDAAEQELRLAMALDPDTGHSVMGLLLEDRARAEEALTELSLHAQTDPRSQLTIFAQAQLLCWMQRYSEAEERLHKLSQMEGTEWLSHWGRLTLADQKLETEEVSNELRWFSEHETDPVERGWIEALGHLTSGDRTRASESIERVRALPGGAEFRPIGFAALYFQRAGLDESFEWIRTAEAHRELELRWWQLDPRNAAVRADPRYSELLKRLDVR
jgi:adenylate cyclase